MSPFYNSTMGTASCHNYSLSWHFGDTSLYRFVFEIPSGTVLPQGTVADVVARTPNGVKVLSVSTPVVLPEGNLPYIDIFINPATSFNIPPGNYVWGMTLKRPYGGDGNYRQTLLPSYSLSVTGVHTLLPDTMLDMAGDTDPPPAQVIKVDASSMISMPSSSGGGGNPPVPTRVPPTIVLSISTTPSIPYIGTPITTTTLTATVTKGTQNLSAEVTFLEGGNVIGTNAVPSNGGVVTFTYNTEYSTDTTFTAQVSDETASVSDVQSVNFVSNPNAGADTIYYGVVAAKSESLIDTINYASSSSIKQTLEVSFDGTGFAFFAYPFSWGTVKTVKDHNAFVVTSNFESDTVNIDGTDYYVYTSKSSSLFDGSNFGPYLVFFP